MPTTDQHNLTGIAETLLIPLFVRARESQRPDCMLHDERAEQIIKRMGVETPRMKLQEHDEVGIIMRLRHFDRLVSDFMENNPQAVVVHIGCGLDTRFERVDNGEVEWFDLDLPEVIELRRKYIGGEEGRYHLLSGSVFDDNWLQAVLPYAGYKFFFLAEGVFPYFEESVIKSLVLKLRGLFPGSELACDAHTPYIVWADNLQLAFSRISARLRWGLKNGREVEKWGEGISMMDEWFYFDDPEPRMASYRWMRRIPVLGKSTGVFHYRLGTPVIG